MAQLAMPGGVDGGDNRGEHHGGVHGGEGHEPSFGAAMRIGGVRLLAGCFLRTSLQFGEIKGVIHPVRDGIVGYMAGGGEGVQGSRS